MLCLSRKVDQRIRISDDIIVVVLGIESDKVRLGVIAPRCIPVHREEVFQRIVERLADAKEEIGE